jgi:hypothetical protein
VFHDGRRVRRNVEFDRLRKPVLGHEGSRLSAKNFGADGGWCEQRARGLRLHCKTE